MFPDYVTVCLAMVINLMLTHLHRTDISSFCVHRANGGTSRIGWRVALAIRRSRGHLKMDLWQYSALPALSLELIFRTTGRQNILRTSTYFVRQFKSHISVTAVMNSSAHLLWMVTFQLSTCGIGPMKRMLPCHLEWHLCLIQIYTSLTFKVERRWFKYVNTLLSICPYIWWSAMQASTCNTYKAIEQANSSRPHLDVTGIGATACCHGFFVPTSVVDFQKGER